MTDTIAALLAGVLAAPDDDAPRLVFADALEEQGDEARAAFIRCQIEIARTENYPGERFCAAANGLLRQGVPDCRKESCRPCWLRRRERALLDIHGADWREEFAQQVGDTASHAYYSIEPEFRCGFIEKVTLTAATFLEHAAALFRAQPVTKVRLSDREPRREEGLSLCAVYCFSWGDGTESPAHVPVELFDYFVSGDVPGFPSHTIYSTPEKALDDLSRACVALGRAKADLPPLR